MESFLSFLFASHYPGLGAEETTNQEMPMVSDKKKKKLNKRIQKEAAYQDRNILKTIVPFQQNTTEKQPATPSPRPAKT